MICPDCGARMGVVDSRMVAGSLRRRRVCSECSLRVTTCELTTTALDPLRSLAEREPGANTAFVVEALSGLEVLRSLVRGLPPDRLARALSALRAELERMNDVHGASE